MNAEPTVLVVDDEEIVCDSCTRILRDEGFSVETSTRPREGLVMAERKDYVAILLDIKMSDMDGIEFLDRLRQAKSDVPVIMITGYPETYDAARCMRLGASDYILKPFTPSQITESIRRATDSLSRGTASSQATAAERVLTAEPGVVPEAPVTAKPPAGGKIIACRVDHCLACKSCEIACALAHSQSQSLAEAILERPRPQRRMTVEAARPRGLPLQCRQCEEGPCQLVCPTGAIGRDEQNGLTLVEEALCIGCKLCAIMCPLGVLGISERNRAIIKCDQCLDRQADGEKPPCVAACQTHALQLVDEEELADGGRRLVAVSIGSTLPAGEMESQTPGKVIPAGARKTGHAGQPRVVVVGSNAAGAMAAIHAAQVGAKVTVVTAEPVTYRRPAIPALIAGHIQDIGEARIFTPGTLKEHGVESVLLGKAVGIDTERKTLTIRTPRAGTAEVCFDAAVLATGGVPARPRIPGGDKPGVCTFTAVEGAQEILHYAERADSAVVVGASFVALEVAEALLERGLKVYFNVRSRVLRRLLEPELSEYLQARLPQEGLQLLTHEAISEIGGADRVEYVIHRGRRIATELVVLGTGVWPNVELAEAAGIRLAESGAIAVDKRMQTSVPGVYAAGDCAEVADFSTGRFVYSAVGSTGASAGALAGINAAGGNQTTGGLLRAQADHILGFQIYSVGHTTTTAAAVGLEVEVHDLEAPPEAEWARDDVVGKLLIDAGGRVVGAQAVTRSHGSQYGWQLYRAVLMKESREVFQKHWITPRRRVAQMAQEAGGGRLAVPPAEEQE